MPMPMPTPTPPANKINVPLSFNAISIAIASPEDMLSWSHGEVKKPEREGLFAKKSLDQPKTGNVIVENINEFVIKELSAKNAVLKLPDPLSEENAWVISN